MVADNHTVQSLLCITHKKKGGLGFCVRNNLLIFIYFVNSRYNLNIIYMYQHIYIHLISLINCTYAERWEAYHNQY